MAEAFLRSIGRGQSRQVDGEGSRSRRSHLPKVSITGTELRRSGGAARAARCLEYSPGSEERGPQVPVWENSVSSPSEQLRSRTTSKRTSAIKTKTCEVTPSLSGGTCPV